MNTKLLKPREFKDGAHWIVRTDYPDYCAAGETLEGARAAFWQGLAQTLWLQWREFGRISLGRRAPSASAESQ